MIASKFIVFEGNEGTGKSTHIQSVSEYLKEINVNHVVTREPGGTEFGESVREVLSGDNITVGLDTTEAIGSGLAWAHVFSGVTACIGFLIAVSLYRRRKRFIS